MFRTRAQKFEDIYISPNLIYFLCGSLVLLAVYVLLSFFKA